MFCEECPAAKFIAENVSELYRPLAVNVAQGLSGAFISAVEGTNGLTDEKVESIRLKEIGAWGPSEEAEILEEQPEIAKAVYGCEEMVTVLGTCALFSAERP